jgi:hypothetical protein
MLTTTFTRDVINARHFEAEVILDGPKETGNLSRWEACYFYVVLLAPADVVQGQSNKGQEGHQSQILYSSVFPVRWI